MLTGKAKRYRPNVPFGRYGSAANSSPKSDAESIKSVVAGLLVHC